MSLEELLAMSPEYAQTQPLDELRQREFSRLDESGHVYLDYTGGSLYAVRLVAEHARQLQTLILGNPHSQNPASVSATRLVEQARADVLAYFRADPTEYAVIFTANASGGLKLVGESYPFGPGSTFVLLADNHNSVHGIREFARARGAAIHYVPLDPVTLRAPELTPHLAEWQEAAPKLFAFPAQSNFSGVQHPLAWVELAHSFGYTVLLDAAAFAPTNRLDLSRVQPDFVPVSFYKMFGYPTGVGALIARRAALAQLRRPWFAGGTVQLVSTKADLHILAEGHEAFEEGTLNYTSLPAISNGLRLLDEIGIERVHARVTALLRWLLAALQSLSHTNGAPLIVIYGPRDVQARGGTIAFNLLDPAGHVFPYQQVEAEASAANISIRSGCFCNPGAGEYSLTHTAAEIQRCVEGARGTHFAVVAFRDCLGAKATGAVRASLGWVSNFADTARFLALLANFRDRPAGTALDSRGC